MLDEFLIQAHAIQQDDISDFTLVLVVTIGLDGDFFPKAEVRGGVLGVVAVGLAFLRAVDAAEADAFSMVTVQYFEGVADDRNDRRGDFV